MFLVVGSGACGELRATAEDGVDTVADRGDELAGFVGVDWVDNHEIFHAVFEVGVFRLEAFEHGKDLTTDLVEVFFGQEAAVEDGSRAVGHTWGLGSFFGLAAEYGVDVDAGVAGAGRLYGRCGFASGKCGLEFVGDGIENIADLVDGTDAEVRHGAVGDAPMRSDFEPVDSAMAEADAVDVGGFGDDDEVGFVFTDPAVAGHVGDSGESSAFFIHASTLFDATVETDSGAADGFDGEDGGSDAGLLVGDPSAVEFAVADEGAEGRNGPAFANGNDVEVAVKVECGAGRGAFDAAEDVDARMLCGVLRETFSGDVVRVVAELAKLVADEFSSGDVILSRGIECGDANEFLEPGDHLVAKGLDTSEDCFLKIYGYGLFTHEMDLCGWVDCGSEGQLDCHLNDTGVVANGTSDLAEGLSPEGSNGLREASFVEEVEDLEAILELVLFAEVENLEQRGVGGVEAGAKGGVACSVAAVAVIDEGDTVECDCWQRETCGVDEVLGG